QRAVDGEGGTHRRAGVPHGRDAPRAGRRGARGGGARRPGAVPGGGGAPGGDRRPRHAARARAAHRPRHPPPARLRPRRARGAPGDVRAPGPAAGGVATAVTAGDVWLLTAAATLVVLAGLFSAADA